MVFGDVLDVFFLIYNQYLIEEDGKKVLPTAGFSTQFLIGFPQRCPSPVDKGVSSAVLASRYRKSLHSASSTALLTFSPREQSRLFHKGTPWST